MSKEKKSNPNDNESPRNKGRKKDDDTLMYTNQSGIIDPETDDESELDGSEDFDENVYRQECNEAERRDKKDEDDYIRDVVQRNCIESIKKQTNWEKTENGFCLRPGSYLLMIKTLINPKEKKGLRPVEYGTAVYYPKYDGLFSQIVLEYLIIYSWFNREEIRRIKERDELSNYISETYLTIERKVFKYIHHENVNTDGSLKSLKDEISFTKWLYTQCKYGAKNFLKMSKKDDGHELSPYPLVDKEGKIKELPSKLKVEDEFFYKKNVSEIFSKHLRLYIMSRADVQNKICAALIITVGYYCFICKGIICNRREIEEKIAYNAGYATLLELCKDIRKKITAMNKKQYSIDIELIDILENELELAGDDVKCLTLCDLIYADLKDKEFYQALKTTLSKRFAKVKSCLGNDADNRNKN